MKVSLTTHMQPIAVLHTDGPEIIIGKHLPITVLRKLCKIGGIVLWDYEGLWTMIDRPRLETLLWLYEDALKCATAYPRGKPSPVRIHHSGTLLIPAGTAKLLLATEDSPAW